ncbi:hypothetical protein C6P46_006457 [Rhodotorula mucilaginosa]|uniref:PB1 domain-containing protein n=1 Tax=Rhodotorula mucilaginosa TaxID=5537 RepID=A0A9P7B967_RHOMI|nr:hypothetical protein C6P46_006457 [Rhodotorula mucilaginosa]
MMKTFKVSHTASRDQPPVLRKFTLPTDRVTLLFATVQHRFQFDPSLHIELFYRDQDGDLITLSSDEDLRELLASPDGQNDVIRLEVTARPRSQPATETEQPAEATAAPASSASAAAAAADDWLEIESVEDEPLLAGFSTQVYGTTIETPVAAEETVASDETTAATATAADPAKPVLPGSFANRLDALIDAEFPRVSPPAATPTVAAAGSDSAATDPADEPLSPLDDPAASTAPRQQQGVGADTPAFSTLPGSFSSILSGLPSHAEAFSAQLATLVGSPDSALGRLSAILTNPTGAVSSGAINLSDLSSSFSNLGIDVGAAVHEVLQSVRSEAEGVRSEFERFKTQVDAEKAKFEAEVRAALEEAKRARAEAASAGPAQAADPEEVPATEEEEDKSSNTRSTHGHGHGHAHRETKEARRSARADKRCYESRYSWAPRDANNEPHRGMNAGGWCRQPKSGSTSARAGYGGGGGWGAPAPSFAAPPSVMRDAPYGMPGSMPFSTANAAPNGSWSGWGGAHAATAGSSSPPPNDPLPSASVSASPSAGATNFAGQEDDDDKPVLLTAFLGSARTIGFDVDDASIRIALTDIWCESNGRGMSAMLDKACEELFS